MTAQRILIAQPTTGSVVSGTVGFLMRLVAALQSRGIAWEYRNLALSDIALSRNIFATFMLERDHTHLLFLDADMGVLPETVLRMLGFDQPVVAAACPKRHVPWERLRQVVEAEAARPEAERRATPDLMDLALSYNVDRTRFDGSPWVAERRGGFLKVPAIGTGIMLIRRDALETMRDRSVARRRPGHADLPLLEGAVLLDFFSPVEVPDGSLVESEDISFCKRWVEDCGGEIWADAGSRVLHYGMRGHSGRYLPRAFADFPELRGADPNAGGAGAGEGRARGGGA